MVPGAEDAEDGVDVDNVCLLNPGWHERTHLQTQKIVCFPFVMLPL